MTAAVPAWPPAPLPVDRRAILRDLVEQVAAFAAAALLVPLMVEVLLTQAPLVAYVGVPLGACTLVGWAFKGQRIAALGGVMATAVAAVIFLGSYPPEPPSLFGWLVPFLEISVFMTCLLAAVVGLAAGGLLLQPHRPVRLARWFFGVAGCVLLVPTCATIGVLVAVPTRASFDMPLPAGWHATPPAPDQWDALVGRDFAAEQDGPPAARPSLGVSVLGATTAASDATYCFNVLPWEDSPFYVDYASGGQADVTNVTLPAGPARRQVRDLEGGGRAYGYALLRSRQVGAISQPLCYLIALNVPDPSRLDPAQADAIVAAFRYR